MNVCRVHPLTLTGHPLKKRARSIITEAASRESRGLIIAALHLVFVSLLTNRPRSTGRRSCGGPATMIMLPVNTGVGVHGGAVIRGIPVITETEDASIEQQNPLKAAWLALSVGALVLRRGVNTS
jgi:hypothetical protein